MILRNPAYLHPREPWPSSLSGQEKQYSQLMDIAKNLIRYCPDLLAGDSSRAIAEGYQELHSYWSSRLSEALQLPDGDPIRQKARQADFSWVADLREREARSQQKG